MANDSGVQPGWYADPLGRFELRYFNGSVWTADVSTNGERFVDPRGIDTATGASPVVGAEPNTAASAAMVLGVIAISIAWLPFIVAFGVVAAVLAVVFGAVGLRRAGATGVGRSRSIVGLITGASGLVAATLGVILTVVVLDVYNAYLEPAAHDIEITSCELAGSRATATGTLTNLDDASADFTILVGFVRPGTDNPDRSSRIALDDVEPGRPVEFQVERQVGLENVDCIVIEVNGPLPFGLALD